MQNYIKYEPIANFPNIVANVRRYVQLAQSRGGTRFCHRNRGQKITIQTAAASRITGS
jgi:hypothetical protein